MWNIQLPLILRASRAFPRGRMGVAGAVASFLLFEEWQRTRVVPDEPGELTKSAPSILTAKLPLLPPLIFSVCEAHLMLDGTVSRSSTIQLMDDSSSRESLSSKYNVQWSNVLGTGAFGAVYLATDRKTGEKVALKKISKQYTDNQAFQREMNALLHLRKAGGHPNICSIREHFDESGCYYVVLDLISGGEMFDHLVSNGAFSEADAARMVREVASALAFVHGLDTVHGDLKPENIMLSSKNPSDAVVKLVDFGCAQVTGEDNTISNYADDAGKGSTGKTPAYCPPEVLDKRRRKPMMEASMDMWALGIILYVMLTGVHPFDLSGNSSDDAIEKRVLSRKRPPLRNSRVTAHLSDSAIDLIERLMAPSPRRRITALEMLNHPWVKGETASQSKIADSDKRLSTYRKFKSKLEAKVFEDIVNWSDQGDVDKISRKTSLIERSFRTFDSQKKGYITKRDLRDLSPKDSEAGDKDDMEHPPLSLSGFSDLLSENMRNKYWPKGHQIYREGEVGNAMYFINSGIIEVVTKDGSLVTRGPGNFFGEGALLHPDKIRSATIRCKTPVHAMEISREYFEKYVAKSGSTLLLTLREKDKIRKRNRAKTILRLQESLKEHDYAKGEYLFKTGEAGNALYLVESGKVDVVVNKKLVFTATPGNVCGEHSVLTGATRNCDAVCVSKEGCIVHTLPGKDFRKLLEESPGTKESFRDLCLRRDFKKAVVQRLRTEFPYDNPRKAFDAVRMKKEYLDTDAVGNLMRDMRPEYTDDEIREILDVVDLSKSGTISFDEFKKVFIADIRTAAAM